MKRVMGLAAIMCVVASSVLAGTVFIANNALYVYAEDGTYTSVGTDWAIAVYQQNGLRDVAGLAGDDVQLHVSTTLWQSPGYFADLTGFSTGGGISAYVRIFNNNAIGLATRFVDLNGLALGDPAGLHPIPAIAGTEFHNWDPGGNAPGDWQDVVPEPGTMALFGLGLLTIVARRRRKS